MPLARLLKEALWYYTVRPRNLVSLLVGKPFLFRYLAKVGDGTDEQAFLRERSVGTVPW